MQLHPIHALITREDDGDPKHETLQDVPGMIASEPEVGSPLQVFFESGKVMRTSAVKHVAHRGAELIVETANSRYRFKTSNAA